MPNQKVWYSIRDLAERFGKSADAVERMLKRGDILAKKMGGTWRVHAEALACYEADGIPERPRGWETFVPAPPRPPSRRKTIATPGCAA